MAKKNQTLDLGQMQADLELATNNLRLATRAKQRADQAFEEAVELHERCRVSLNAGVQTLKSSTTLPNLFAQ